MPRGGSHKDSVTARRWLAESKPLFLAIFTGYCPGPRPAWLPRLPLLLLFCFWEGPEPPLRSPPPPHVGAVTVRSIFRRAQQKPAQKVKDPHKGPCIIKETVFISQGRGDENKQNKCRRRAAPTPPPPHPLPLPHENSHPFYRNFTAKSLNVIIIIISLLEIV